MGASEVNSPNLQKLADLLIKYGVPVFTIGAVGLFLTNEELPEKDYLARIMSPITIWSKTTKMLQPNSQISIEEHFSYILFSTIAKFKIPKKEVNTFVNSVIADIAMDTTVIQIQPYVNHSELRELITEYIDDIKPLLNYRTATSDTIIGSQLLKKVYTPNSQARITRDYLIVKLKSEGWSYKKIEQEITRLNLPSTTLEDLKQIKYRMTKKTREQKK